MARTRPEIMAWPTEGSRVTLVTCNWCSKCTWYEKATRVVDEVATDSGDQLTYELANTAIIDTYHGKITGEDYLKDASDNSFRAVVKVNDVEKTEQDPYTGSGGDYTVDYTLGEVTFLSALQGGDVVKVTYHYASDSTFTIKPSAGKKLMIKDVEVQFSENIVLTDTVIFQAYGLVEVFAPQLTPSPYPAGTLIPLGNPTVYKTMSDYINEANGALPSLPALGGAGWRGTQQPTHIFPWRYQAMTELSSAAGMEIRVSLANDTEFNGEIATATFYCLSEDE